MAGAELLRRVPAVQSTRDRFRGCLLGGIAADRRMTERSQTSLFTAEGLLRGWARFKCSGQDPAFADSTARSYFRWMITQGMRPRTGALNGQPGWLVRNGQMFEPGGCGSTSVMALSGLSSDSDRAQNDANDGTVVARVAPVGLFLSHWLDRGERAVDRTFALAKTIASITHGNYTAQYAAGTFSVVVALMIGGMPPDRALELAVTELRRYPGHETLLAAIDPAKGVPGTYGETAEQSLAIGLRAAMRAPDYESAIASAGPFREGAYLAGCLLGCRDGVGVVPESRLAEVRVRALVEQIADDLATVPVLRLGDPNESTVDRFYLHRYPPD